MAALTVQNITDSGTAPTFGAASSSMTVPVGSGNNTFLVVKNGSGSAVTLGISVSGKTDYGVSNPAVSVTVAATTGECWLPLRKAHINPDTPGVATVTLSSATTVTVALVRLS